MRTWSQLESDFRNLAQSGFVAFLHHHYGACDESWGFSGSTKSNTVQHFEVLASVAGKKLLALPVAHGSPDIRTDRSNAERWYRALITFGRNLQVDLPAIVTDRNIGSVTGYVYCEHITNVAEASANLCCTLEAQAFPTPLTPRLLADVPRYAGPHKHWEAAQTALTAEEPDYPDAAREAVNAVEALCQVILGDDSVILGNALDQLKAEGRLHGAIAKSLKAMYGFASEELRHGSATPSSPPPHELLYVVQASGAAITLLLATDKVGR